MAEANSMSHIIRGVIAQYPRVNRPYRFDQTAGERGKSVPCDPSDDGAKYETGFRMTKEQAKELYKAMTAAYAEKKQAKWPVKLPTPAEVFSEQEDGTYTGKAVLKGAYGEQLTAKPSQYDAKNKKLDDDFMLTTGSKIHVQVTFVPYSMRDHGVSLRLRAIQVIDLKPMEDYSPFGAEDGFSIDEAPESVFGFEIDDTPADVAVAPDTRSEEAPEPVKKVTKKTAPPPKETDDGLGDILSDWE